MCVIIREYVWCTPASVDAHYYPVHTEYTYRSWSFGATSRSLLFLTDQPRSISSIIPLWLSFQVLTSFLSDGVAENSSDRRGGLKAWCTVCFPSIFVSCSPQHKLENHCPSASLHCLVNSTFVLHFRRPKPSDSNQKSLLGVQGVRALRSMTLNLKKLNLFCLRWSSLSGSKQGENSAWEGTYVGLSGS